LVIIITNWNTKYQTVDVFSEAIAAIGQSTIDKNEGNVCQGKNC
jgi:hypothetical protein